ncbi:MAG: hypothetical protein K0R75_3558, partial [Paenibacillaceae bacterium]|nr:hypothetical protein [Paenibacillaceae bacterium]
VTENVYGDYAVSYSGDADPGGQIVLNPGDNKTVTVTNDDIPVPKKLPDSVHIDFSYAYINGYDTGGVGPKDSLTREQVSASIYRILKQAGKTIGYVKPSVSDFRDLETDKWSYAAIEYMVSIGAIPKSTSVYPTQPVTRGEMAKIIAMSSGLTDKRSTVSFPDLPPSHPDYDYMNMLVNAGLLVGYPDGSIHPDALITRSEYITMINRFIGRDSRYNVAGRPSLYNDLEPGYWAFDEIQRASFGFFATPDDHGVYQVDPNIGISKADLDN